MLTEYLPGVNGTSIGRNTTESSPPQDRRRAVDPYPPRLAAVLRTIPRAMRQSAPTRGDSRRRGFRAACRVVIAPELLLIREIRVVFHGLRKSAVVMLLEAGATEAEVMAITVRLREMVAHYARQLNQRRLAVSGNPQAGGR